MKNALLSLALLLTTTLSVIAQSDTNMNGFDLTPVIDRIATSYGVAKGRITGMEVYWNQEQTRCYNHYTIEVEQAIKGKLPQQIVVVQECATSNMSLQQETAAQMTVGSELIAFFDRIPKDWECGYTPRHAYASVFNYQPTADMSIEFSAN